MWVYETEEFKRVAERHGLREIINRLNERIDEAQNRTEVAQRVKPRWPWFLKKESNFRLIGGIERFRQKEVFVWYRLFVRGEPGYTPFRNLINDRDTVLQHFDREDFAQWFDLQIETKREDVLVEVLPSTFYSWFQPIHQAIATITDSSSDVFLESREWVARIPHEGRDDLRAYYRIVSQIEASKKEDEQLFRVCRMDDDAKGSDATIIYTRIDANTWYLLAPTRKKLANDFVNVPFSGSKEALRSASRAYPAWVLADDALWLDIQREKDANLALSIEERQILERVAGLGQSAHSLPMFINGQAGSGKSTMLAYLFVGLLKKKIDDELEGYPLFITYSDRLIDSARKATIRLLQSGFDTNARYREFDPSGLFVTWQEFLLELLPSDRRAEFPSSKRVTFRDLKAAMENRPGTLRPYMSPTRFSPETIWFVIRSLIKGSESNEIFDPDDYESEVPEQDRLVSVEDFQAIFTREFEWYRRQLESGGLWDDQDLVKAVLDNGASEDNKFRMITALVVDEAQDFTRCELRLLARQLIYTNYAIPDLRDIRVPIVLAGDPLQTLSPTGFKWPTIRSAFYSELRSMLGEEAHTPEFYPLQNNYRSKPGVVGFANLVQAWRARLFGLEIKAQGAWSPQDENSFAPRKFTLDDGSRAVEEFTRLLTDTMTVIPVDEGGEIEFVKNDPILASIYPDASETSRPFTVVSASAVKGLEFGKVVLYKFGDHDLPQISWESADERDELSAEYFFNKLYVGVTRATQDLFVVDTVRGSEQLWSHFSEREAGRLAPFMGSFLEPIDENGIRGHLLGIEETVEGMEGLEEQNPRENAMKLKSFGIDTRDPRLIRRAESYFKRAGDLAEMRLCNAFALRFEGDHEGAAREFISIGEPQKAWEDSWQSQDWQLMGEILRESPKVIDDEIRSAVLFMNTPSPTMEDSKKALESIVSLNHRNSAPGVGDKAWKGFISKLLTTITFTGLSETDSTKVATGLELLGKQGFRDAALKAGDFYLEIGRLEDAENSWIRAGDEALPRLARLRAEREGLPQGLKHLMDASLHDEVISEWLGRGKPNSPLWIEAIVSSFRASGRASEGVDALTASSIFIEATDLLLHLDPEMLSHVERYKSLIKAIARGSDAPLLLETIERLRVSIPVKEGSSSRIRPLHLLGVEQLILSHHEAGWIVQPELWSKSVSILVGPKTGILSWDLDDTSRQIDPFILGAAFELGGFWEKASDVYERQFDSRDDFKRTESRIRWMYCQTQWEDELRKRSDAGRRRGQTDTPAKIQRHRLEMANRWKMSGDEQKRAVKQRIPRLSRRTKQISEASSSGEYKSDNFAFSFRLRPEQEAVTIRLENVKTLDSFEFNYFLGPQEVRIEGETHPLQNGEYSCSPDSWKPHGVTISHQGQLIIRLTRDVETLKEFIVLEDPTSSSESPKIPPRRTGTSSRTTPRKQGVKVFELASELSTNVNSLKRAFRSLNISPGKDGNSRLTDDEADRVRAWYRGSKTID